MLKCDLHIHTKDDPDDGKGTFAIPYSAQELIDYAHSLHFNVLSITLHEKAYWSEKINAYAKRKGILLIPGCEMTVAGMHILIYHKEPRTLSAIVTAIQKKNTLSAIKEHKKDSLVIAPHPYYRHKIFKKCLGENIQEHITVFDAVEYCHFYYKFLSFNNPAKKLAEKNNLALIGTSDMHRLYQMGHTYTLIDSTKDIEDVFLAIRQNRIQLITHSLPLKFFLKRGFLCLLT